MSKIKRLIILMVLIAATAILLSSCDIADIFDFDIGGIIKQTSQTTQDVSQNPGGECTHQFGEWEVVVDSTCTQKGKQVRVCTLCMYIENSDVYLKSHTVEVLEKVNSTCQTEGKTEGSMCSVCKTVLKAQDSISKKPHTYSNGICTMCGSKKQDCSHKYGTWNIVKAASCTVEGVKERACSLCGDKEQVSVPTTAHTEVIDKAVNATCTTTGLTQGKHCSSCGKIIIAQQVIKAKGHTYVEGVCSCGAKDENYNPIKYFTVIFKNDDGTILSTQTVKEGSNAKAPAVPKKEGYEFIGWSGSVANIRSNITVTAVYRKVSTTKAPQFVVSTENSKRGDTVEVTVALKNNPGIASIILSVAYDSNALTLTNVVYNNTIGGQTVPPQYMNSPIKLYWINGFANASGDFVLATLRFTVNSNASLGDHNITVTYNENDIYDISETNLPFEVVNGKVTVKQ